MPGNLSSLASRIIFGTSSCPISLTDRVSSTCPGVDKDSPDTSGLGVVCTTASCRVSAGPVWWEPKEDAVPEGGVCEAASGSLSRCVEQLILGNKRASALCSLVSVSETVRDDPLSRGICGGVEVCWNECCSNVGDRASCAAFCLSELTLWP